MKGYSRLHYAGRDGQYATYQYLHLCSDSQADLSASISSNFGKQALAGAVAVIAAADQ